MDGSETRPYTTLGLDGSETRPYTTIRDPSLHGQDCERRGPYPPGSVYEACRGWEASGLSPTSRKSGEKWGTPAAPRLDVFAKNTRNLKHRTRLWRPCRTRSWLIY